MPEYTIDWRAVGCGCAAAAVSYKIAANIPLPRGFDHIPFAPMVAKGPLAFFLGHAADELFGLSKAGADVVSEGQLPRPLEQVGRIQMGRDHSIIIGHPDDLEYVLHENGNNFPKDPKLYNVFTRIVGKSSLLAQTDVDIHRRDRKNLRHAFSPNALKHISDSITPRHAAWLLHRLEERVAESQSKDEGFSISTDYGHTTLRVITEAAFKTEGEKETERVAQIFDWIATKCWSMLRLVPILDMMFIPSNLKLKKYRVELGEQIRKIRQRMLEKGEVPSDSTSTALIEHLMYSNAFSEESLIDQGITFMFAGEDTTRVTLSWLTYLLAKHPQAQEKLYEKLSELLGPMECGTVDQLKNCTFLTYCIKEALRIYPTAPGTLRTTLKDDVLPGTKTFIPKGTQIAVQFWVPQHHESIWGPDAAEFRPERWADLAANGNPVFGERAFFGFSRGARSCIGKDFAMNELMILGAAVYRNYKLTLVPGQKEPHIVATPIIYPRDPIHYSIERREE